MTGETRQVTCVYAMAGLKRNSTKLMVIMCIGIALALYGIYVQTRSQSNPNYMPSLTLASHWLYHNVGQRIAHPSTFLTGSDCKTLKQQAMRSTFGYLFMGRFVAPITRYSGLMNGAINLGQLVLLRLYCRSIKGTDAIIGLSALGLIISMICLAGSFATCKLMCISCLGTHHIAIIYLAICRRKIIKNISCPAQADGPNNSCSFGGAQSGGKPSVGGGSSSAHQHQQQQNSSTATRKSSLTGAGSGQHGSGSCLGRPKKPADRRT